MTLDSAYTQVGRLVKKFKALSPSERKGLNENATRQGYILPLFRALQWDTDNVDEVSPEEKVSRGWVDFSFRLSGIPRFFLETKKASEDLNDSRWVKQAIDYAWTKSVTWALLSDFEGLRVFNAEWKEEDPFRAQFIEFTVETYLSDFERLWWLSRSEAAAGRLDREAEKVGKRTRREPVSQHLFDDLKVWRHDLFRHLSAYNRMYSAAQIDEAVLRILNRLIFIRTTEDREVEPPRLRALVRELKDKKQIGGLPRELAKLFRQFDETYNSELFARHFSEELDCESKPYEDLIGDLYEKRFVRYNFNAIDADVLGTAYEQYLGHVVSDPDAAEIVERRQKRKSQGIYYTPTFVVKYIVQQTLGRYLDERGYSPSQPPRVLDMACGSGSFLIEAFDTLDRFVAQRRGQLTPTPTLPHPKNTDGGGSWEGIHDYARRMEILTQCIYGVDKDKQAVEVARLNLLLRALHQRGKLPMLANIRCGDSLISGSPDELRAAFGDEWKNKQPFNWEKEFGEVFSLTPTLSQRERGNELPSPKGRGVGGEGHGFDIIIGNPPYVSFGLRGAEKRDKHFDSFVRGHYPNSAEYKLSTYALFMNRAIDLLKDKGLFGFIVPDSFLLGRYFSKLRRYILDTCVIREIVLFAADFWPGATIGLPVVLILHKENSQQIRQLNKVEVKLCESLESLGLGDFTAQNSYEQAYFEETPYNRFRLFFKAEDKLFVEKLEKVGMRAQEIVSIHTGVRSKIGQAKIVGRKPKGETWRRGLTSGSSVRRFSVEWGGDYLNISPELLFAGGWDAEIIKQPKILLRQTGDSLICGLDEEGLYHLNNVHSIVPKDKTHSLKYVMALLNSRLLNTFYHLITLELGRAMAQTDIETLEKLPIRRINFADPVDKARHDALVQLVEEMLDLQKERAEAGELDDRRHALARRIEAVDREIDMLVYELYGLTEDEIKIVEGKT